MSKGYYAVARHEIGAGGGTVGVVLVQQGLTLNEARKAADLLNEHLFDLDAITGETYFAFNPHAL